VENILERATEENQVMIASLLDLVQRLSKVSKVPSEEISLV
jgi:hypothetical protein